MKRSRRTPEELPKRLRRHVEGRSWWRTDGPAVVAFSGGLDSLVLLHLLRFTPGLAAGGVLAAHFDHGMRVGSGDDAAWVKGLCRAWDIPLRRGVARTPPGDEARARELRYAFLERVRQATGGGLVLTAHQADDQVETVLFRLLRGTGPDGLAGIPEWRRPGVGRPLLPFRRQELEDYARALRLRPREDPSNRDPAFARNRIRRQLLPLLESIHPGAWRSLDRVAALAEKRRRAMVFLLEPHVAAVIEDREKDLLRIRRDRFLDLPPEVRAEVLRALMGALGARLSRRATQAALAFMSKGVSGRWVELSGGILLSREFQWFLLERGASSVPDPDLHIGPVRPAGGTSTGLSVPLRLSSGSAPGVAMLRLGQRSYRVSWWIDEAPQDRGPALREGAGGTVLTLSSDVSPLAFRGRRPGDRLRIPGGTRRLKRLMGELQVPRGEREELPLLVDREGAVLWIPGRWRSPALERRAGTNTWSIGVEDAGDDT